MTEMAFMVPTSCTLTASGITLNIRSVGSANNLLMMSANRMQSTFPK